MGLAQGGVGGQDPQSGGGQARGGQLWVRRVGLPRQVPQEEGRPDGPRPPEEAGHRHRALHCLHAGGGGDHAGLADHQEVVDAESEESFPVTNTVVMHTSA